MRAPVIRPPGPGDTGAVAGLLTGAFPGTDAAALVRALTASGEAELSLLAEAGGETVGHVLFSRMRAPEGALVLAPVTVAEGWRGRGIATAMVQEGLRRVEEGGWRAVFVLGDSAYFERLGFDATAAERFGTRFDGPSFLVRALGGAALHEITPEAEFPAAFDRLD